MTVLGNIRAYWLGAVVCIGGFLFGYDSGIVGGVLTMASYEQSFHYTAKQSTRVSSLAVGIQQAGAFVGCFIIWPLTAWLGRRLALTICSLVFCIGVIIQTVDTHSLSAFYVGRVIAGLGLGGATVVVPMFSSEMTPKNIRGQVGSFFQLFFTLGIFTSYWIDWGVSRDFKKPVPKQWQIPIGLQLVPGALLGIGMLTLKESTRWLTKKGRHDEAWESLAWIRADRSAETQAEMEEIQTGVAIEERATAGFRFVELLEPDNFKRISLAFAVFTAQQATGATAFAYYGPQYFKLLVGAGQRDLLLTAIFGAVKVAACATFVFFVSERVGRRQVLIWGAVFMACCQVTTAAVVKAKPVHSGNTPPPVTSSGIATVAMIYLFVIIYNFSWGPLPWPYCSEIFPARIREPGVATGVAAQWLFNFVFSLTTPYMISSMGWGTFLLWGVFDLVIAIFAFFFLQETRGKSLEKIAHTDLPEGKQFVEPTGDVNYGGKTSDNIQTIDA